MKNRFFVVVLLCAVVAVGLSACGSKETKKSNDVGVTSVTAVIPASTVEGVAVPPISVIFQQNGFNFVGTVDKGGLPAAWNLPVTLTLTIATSHPEAKITGTTTGNFTTAQTFTVTAEDGKASQPYTVVLQKGIGWN